MLEYWLSYLLVALIACQSVLAVTDSHELPTVLSKADSEIVLVKANDQQTEFAAVEQAFNQVINKAFNKTSSTIEIDHCDHCGFCHNGQLIVAQMSFSHLPNTPLLTSQYNVAAPWGSATLLYRPPKV